MKKLIILLLTTSLFANFTNEGGTVTIDSDVSVVLIGNFYNNGEVYNYGYLEVNGNYYNEDNGSFFNVDDGIFVNNNFVGDINGDTEVNIQDILILIIGILECDDWGQCDTEDHPQYAVYDISGEGTVNVVDIVFLVNIILEL